MDDDGITDTDHVDADLGGHDTGALAHCGEQQSPQTKQLQPTLFHRVKNERSVLALVVSDQKIYAGTQGGEILVRAPVSNEERVVLTVQQVWSLETYERIFNVAAHRGSVLCLYLSQDGKLLFSSAGDAIVNVSKPEESSIGYHSIGLYRFGARRP